MRGAPHRLLQEVVSLRIGEQVPRHGEVRLPGGRSEPVRTYGAGRVCAVVGCTTRLSRYNPSPYCSLHAKAMPPMGERRQRRDVPVMRRRCAYEPCGHEFTTTNAARKFCSDRCRMRAFQERQRLAKVA
jgi:hypothetical protein